MAAQTMWSCRDSVRRGEETRYSVKDSGAKACWEIVREVDAFSFNVCSDCLVYVAGQKDSILSRNEIQEIMMFKGINVLSGSHCQQFTNAMAK